MKNIIILLAFVFNNAMAADKPFIDLTSQNLELLSLNSSSKSNLDKYVLDMIKTKHAKEYYKIIKDKQKVNELIQKHTKEVQHAASKISNKTVFKFSQNTQFTKYDETKSLLKIKSFILGSIKPISTNKTRDDGMPSNFLLLIPNMDLLQKIKADKSKFNSLLETRTNKLNKQLYIEVYMVLPKFQNTTDFQAVIKEIKLYDSENKKILLTTVKEERSISDLIDNWFLSDGYTNKLVGIHAFSFYGHRLQDIILSVSSMSKYCHKTQKLGPHQVIVCNRPRGENIIIVATYIGGIVAKIDLVAKNTLNEADKKSIMRKMRMDFKQPKSILNQKITRWSRFNVDFSFYSDALLGLKSKESKYEYTFGSGSKYKDSDFTLVVSMMSHETEKLIEEYK